MLGAAGGTHTDKSFTHQKKSLIAVVLKAWSEDLRNPQDSFREVVRSFPNPYLCEAQSSSYTSARKTSQQIECRGRYENPAVPVSLGIKETSKMQNSATLSTQLFLFGKYSGFS